MLNAQNSLRANCHLIPDNKIQLFVQKMLSGERRLRNVKMSKCQPQTVKLLELYGSGKSKMIFMNKPPHYLTCFVLQGLTFRKQSVLLSMDMLFIQEYEKMKKHCGYTVLIEHNGENFLAFVQYFLYESHSTTVFAVVKWIILDFANPFLVSEKPRHLLRIAGEEDQHTSGLCTGKSSISLWKFKPCVCIKSSKFLWSLSLT